MPGIILNISEETATVLEAVANRYQVSVSKLLLLYWLKPQLDEATKQWHADRWEQRRRVLEMNAALATQVDAGGV